MPSTMILPAARTVPASRYLRSWGYHLHHGAGARMEAETVWCDGGSRAGTGDADRGARGACAGGRICLDRRDLAGLFRSGASRGRALFPEAARGFEVSAGGGLCDAGRNWLSGGSPRRVECTGDRRSHRAWRASGLGGRRFGRWRLRRGWFGWWWFRWRSAAEPEASLAPAIPSDGRRSSRGGCHRCDEPTSSSRGVACEPAGELCRAGA
jgi:hypothetical protein